MYLKMLSSVTIAFLAIVFVIMAQTVPSATGFVAQAPNAPFINIICLEKMFHPSADVKHI